MIDSFDIWSLSLVNCVFVVSSVLFFTKAVKFYLFSLLVTIITPSLKFAVKNSGQKAGKTANSTFCNFERKSMTNSVTRSFGEA